MFHPAHRGLSLVLLTAIILSVLTTRHVLADGFFVDAQTGHTAMPAYGRDTGITYLEFMPHFLQDDESIIFGNIRGFLNNEGNVGGNAGLGYRFLEPNQVFLLGMHGGYGADQSLDKIYQQMYFGLEGLTRYGGLTSNFYFPIGDDSQVLETSIGNQRRVGNQLVMDTIDTVGVAMQGLDVNLSAYVPGEFAEEHNMEAIVSWYHYTGSDVEGIDGVKLLVQGDLVPSLSANVGVSNDDTFGTNVTLGMTFRFGNNDIPDRRLDRQLRRFVDVNPNVIVSKKAVIGTNIPIINPTTGNPYVVQNVGMTATASPVPGSTTSIPTPDGTPQNQFSTVADAQIAGADLIFLENGTVIDEQIVLQDGQMLVGLGNEFDILTENYGVISLANVDGATGDVETALAPPTIMPQATGGSGPPTFAPAIIMADNSAVTGINISGSGNSTISQGILASGINDFIIKDVTVTDVNGEGVVIDDSHNGAINNLQIQRTGTLPVPQGQPVSGGDGLVILDHDGTLEFEDVQVTDSYGNGVLIDGGTGYTVFSGDLLLSGNGNGNGTADLMIRNLDLITTIDDQGTTDTSDDVEEDIFGQVFVENLVIESSTANRALELHDNIGLVDVFDTNITTDNATAIHSRNSDLLILRDGSVATTNGTAIDLEDSRVDIQIETITATNATYGIRMVNTTGTVLSRGDSTEGVGSGGGFTNVQTGFYARNSGSLGMAYGQFTDNDIIADLDSVAIFEIQSSNITGTGRQFFEARNVKQFGVTNNAFEENSLTTANGIHYVVDTAGGYVARITRNSIDDAPHNFFMAETAFSGSPTATDASLDLDFSNNSINMDKASSIAASLDWTGPLDATFSTNLITGTALNQKGIQLWTGDSAESATVTINDNAIGFTEQSGTGIEILADSPTNAVVVGNIIEFRGEDGTGVRASGSRISQFGFSGNLIDDYAGGATGFLFPSLHDSSQVVFNGNEVNLHRSNLFVDRGFVISNVTGDDDPFVELISTLNNEINGATTTLSVPPNGTSGRLLINNQVFQ